MTNKSTLRSNHVVGTSGESLAGDSEEGRGESKAGDRKEGNNKIHW